MMYSKIVALFALAVPALGISITGPSSSLYWVQFTSNNITWTSSSGDPNPIDITITNPNDTFLNGPFSIQRSVDLSNGTFTVTNVTLKVATGYVVNFVNSTNQTQIFASSGAFEVKAPGTAKAGSSNSTSTSGGNSTSTNGTGTAATSSVTGTSTSPAGGSNSSSSSAAVPMRFGGGDSGKVLGMLAFTGLMSLVGAAVTL